MAEAAKGVSGPTLPIVRVGHLAPLIGHPNPDLSLRFLGPTEGQHLVAIALCREISGGLATVETEVWQQQSLVATGISTSLLLSQS